MSVKDSRIKDALDGEAVFHLEPTCQGHFTFHESMDKKTLVLQIRTKRKPKTRYYFIFQHKDNPEWLFIRKYNGTPLGEDKAKMLVFSQGGKEAVLARCGTFNGGMTDFLALSPEGKGQALPWKKQKNLWKQHLMDLPEKNDRQATLVIAFMLAQQLKLEGARP